MVPLRSNGLPDTVLFILEVEHCRTLHMSRSILRFGMGYEGTR